MEVKVLEESKNRIVVELKDEDATLCNSIRKELWNDEAVKSAAYSVQHPSLKTPQIIVETSGKEPRQALLDAIKRLKKSNEKFKNSFLKEIK